MEAEITDGLILEMPYLSALEMSIILYTEGYKTCHDTIHGVK